MLTVILEILPKECSPPFLTNENWEKTYGGTSYSSDDNNKASQNITAI